MAVYRPGQMLDGLVERDKHASFFHSKPQQVTICSLLMTKQTGRKRSRQSSPRFGDGPIAIAGSPSKVGEDSSSLCNRAGTGSIDWIRRHPDQARLGEGPPSLLSPKIETTYVWLGGADDLDPRGQSTN